MMSDTLFDTVERIEYYQNTFPLIYEDYAAEIETLKTRINALREILDAPSSNECLPNYKKKLERLKREKGN